MNKLKLTMLSLGCVALFTGCGSSFQPMNDMELKIMSYETKLIEKDVSFAIARPDIIIKTNMSANMNRGLSKRLEYNSNKIACHLESELEKLIISKGITVTDRFKSRNEMTFTQKRDTSALFYPKITISITENSMTVYDDRRFPLSSKGGLTSKTKIDIIMLEPLSGEKIWIKSIPVNSSEINIDYDGYIAGNGNPTMIEKKIIPVAESFDSLLVSIDDEIIKATNKYIDIEEFRFLNNDIKKLKQIKRY